MNESENESIKQRVMFWFIIVIYKDFSTADHIQSKSMLWMRVEATFYYNLFREYVAA